jgi:CcmD family protein
VSALASLAALPALPLHEAGKYVAAAYVVVFAVVLVYVVIMSVRLGRVQRELDDLRGRERKPQTSGRQETLAEPPLR